MKASTLHFVVFGLLLSLILPVKSNGQTSADFPSRQAIHKFFDAISNFDYDTINALTTDDFVLVENGELWNTDSLITNIKPSDERGVTIRYRLSDFDVDRDGDTAWIVYQNHGTFSKGDKSRTYRWTESAVLHRAESGWKIEILHSTKTDQHTNP